MLPHRLIHFRARRGRAAASATTECYYRTRSVAISPRPIRVDGCGAARGSCRKPFGRVGLKVRVLSSRRSPGGMPRPAALPRRHFADARAPPWITASSSISRTCTTLASTRRGTNCRRPAACVRRACAGKRPLASSGAERYARSRL